MSTPAFSVPALTPKEINRALEEEERRQRDATPEPKFRKQDAPQPYDLLCQIEHRKFTPEEVDIIRMGIDQPMYWEREAQLSLFGAIYYNSTTWKGYQGQRCSEMSQWLCIVASRGMATQSNK